MPICRECQREFIPKKHAAHREVCYNPECIEAREARNRRTKADKVSRLRHEKRWKAHTCAVHGTGRGNYSKLHSGIFRNCLDCQKRFEVPLETDWYICPGCHAKHTQLLDECNEEALGVASSSFKSDSLGNGGRRELRHSGGD
jgi:hypothetical protein